MRTAEMKYGRNIRDCATLTCDFVQKNCQEYLNDVAQNNKHQIVENGVAQQHQKCAGREQKLEILPADKLTAKNTRVVIKVGKRDIGTGHRRIRHK